MAATKNLEEVLKQFPHFKPGWSAIVNGVQQPPGTVVELRHPQYGSVQHVVVMKADGTPAFDRPLYHEAPFAQTIVYGKGADARIRMGFVVQERPHADAPGEQNYQKPNEPVLFMTCTMGFKDQVRGKLESDLETALREMREEMGTAAIVSEWTHDIGHNPSPSFASTWGAVTALEIDLSTLVNAVHDPAEPIAGRYWLTVGEWKDAVADGYYMTVDGKRAYTGHDVSIGAVSIFLAAHPEIERGAFDED